MGSKINAIQDMITLYNELVSQEQLLSRLVEWKHPSEFIDESVKIQNTQENYLKAIEEIATQFNVPTMQEILDNSGLNNTY